MFYLQVTFNMAVLSFGETALYAMAVAEAAGASGLLFQAALLDGPGPVRFDVLDERLQTWNGAIPEAVLQSMCACLSVLLDLDFRENARSLFEKEEEGV